MKEYYPIHELAKLFDLCPDTLRYYERIGWKFVEEAPAGGGAYERIYRYDL